MPASVNLFCNLGVPAHFLAKIRGSPDLLSPRQGRQFVFNSGVSQAIFSKINMWIKIKLAFFQFFWEGANPPTPGIDTPSPARINASQLLNKNCLSTDDQFKTCHRQLDQFCRLSQMHNVPIFLYHSSKKNLTGSPNFRDCRSCVKGKLGDCCFCILHRQLGDTKPKKRKFE